MIDKRISDVLKSIAKTELVFELVKQSMINFNFDKEWKLATSKLYSNATTKSCNKFFTI